MRSDKKRVFKDILIVTSILLLILPLIVTFSTVLTTFFEKMQWYRILQDFVVPFESKLVAVIIKFVGIAGKVTTGSDFSLILVKTGGEMIPITLEWNCLGWQSMILLGITLISGLRGNHTIMSKIETVLIGIIGTFLINLLRMSFIVSLSYYWNSFAAIIIHDYFASFIALIWMVLFWWFSYKFVLEEKMNLKLQ